MSTSANPLLVFHRQPLLIPLFSFILRAYLWIPVDCIVLCISQPLFVFWRFLCAIDILLQKMNTYCNVRNITPKIINGDELHIYTQHHSVQPYKICNGLK